VFEHTANGELGARRRVVELIGTDLAHDSGKEGTEFVELVEYLHWFSFGLGSRIVDQAAMGNGEFGGLSVAAQLDELDHPPRSRTRRVGLTHVTIL
jgi:hypothetical protein